MIYRCRYMRGIVGMKYKALVICLALLAVFSSVVFAASADQTVYLVRHAEKVTDGSADPALTVAGAKRAATFAHYFENKGLKAVYSSDTVRTRDTAAPTAKHYGQEIILYDPRDMEAIAKIAKARGDTILIVGHSNTTAVLVNLLAGGDLPNLKDHHYDRIYIVTLRDDGTSNVNIEHVEPLTP